jgi:hypothetical protein
LKGATLLQGFVTCGTCGQNLHVGWTQYKKGDKKIRETGFYCRNVACTDKAFCRSKPLDDEVAARIIGYMTWKTEERLKGTSLEGKGTMRIEGNDSRSEIAEAERALEEADYELNAWLDNIELMPIIGKEQWNAKAADLATMRNVAKADLEELRLQDTTQDTWMRLEDLWAEWTLESKREFLLKTLSDCILTPAHRRHIPVAERVIIRLYGSVVHDRWLVAPNKWYRSYPPDEGQELVDREEWDRQFIEMWERKSTDGSLDEMIAQAWKRYGK